VTDVRFLQLDVFSEHVGGGNPLGVVIGADDWTDAAMQRFAAWTDLVETTYLLPPTEPSASYRLRIFTPRREIAFAGHPTVGSAHAALETGFAPPRDGLLVQECGAGLLPVRVDGAGAARTLAVAAPAARTLPIAPDHVALVDAALRGTTRGTLAPAFVEGGRRWWVAELSDETAVRSWQPDHAAILRLAETTDSLGLCVFARSLDAPYQLVVRAFPAGVGIVEDPASGAANGLIAAYLLEREPQGPLAAGYTVSQGREIGRDASIRIDCDAHGRIWVGGRSHTVVDGMLRWR
jgi:PhzF family phenazine biosynthesis protein